MLLQLLLLDRHCINSWRETVPAPEKLQCKQMRQTKDGRGNTVSSQGPTLLGIAARAPNSQASTLSTRPHCLLGITYLETNIDPRRICILDILEPEAGIPGLTQLFIFPVLIYAVYREGLLNMTFHKAKSLLG